MPNPANSLTILITGTSVGGLGSSLALAFHARGHRVFAAARNPSKVTHLTALGITHIPLDVLSSTSIAAAVTQVSALTGGTLDMLINNAGGGYSIPLLDADLQKGREFFDLNVWSVLAVTQTFAPLLLKSASERGEAAVVNQTSIAAVTSVPIQGLYNASKAALAMISDTLRLELEPFGIRVVDLRTGSVKTPFYDNQIGGGGPKLPEESIYQIARERVEEAMSGTGPMEEAVDAKTWAEGVVADLLDKGWFFGRPNRIWRGGNALVVRAVTQWVPVAWTDAWLRRLLAKMMGMDVVKRNWESGRKGVGK
ncbi:NAD(P)-binding protein [Mytilinidion resinicola]|uniref:NAD(P)-binding protein n=1 Tax=Mytilinidion resinicola TaxID=574789 RepID=A0A6A6Y0E5_9PEZI|nr:NAD(P)-binding protein [Mytilinidion resinicola]KAF2801484.1 NAD(P)-binding protein [Mytilinidion resinicola]